MSKKANLANEEWDFSILEKAPRSLIHRALLWELDREIGSGKEPFLKTAECRQALSNPSSLRGTATGVTELGRPNAKTRPFEEAISFGIDWSQPRDELVRQFGLWRTLRSRPVAYWSSQRWANRVTPSRCSGKFPSFA